MTDIAFTSVAKPYGWLGNMSPYPIVLDGIDYRTSEAAFQCLRFAPDHPVRELIREQKSPMAAKMVMKPYRGECIVAPQSEQDVDNMEAVLRAKLACHPNLIADLVATADALIVEDTTMRKRSDRFWGAAKINGVWDGANILGNLWMMLRSEHM